MKPGMSRPAWWATAASIGLVLLMGYGCWYWWGYRQPRMMGLNGKKVWLDDDSSHSIAYQWQSILARPAYWIDHEMLGTPRVALLSPLHSPPFIPYCVEIHPIIDEGPTGSLRDEDSGH